MGKFGWAHISDAKNLGSGPNGAVQFASGSDGEISGSATFTYDYVNTNLILSGNMDISGTITAHVFDVKQTTKEEISVSGSTFFGDSSDDIHAFTGSVIIVSGAIRQYYHELKTTSYSVNVYDSIIGVSSSAYVSIIIPSASVAGAGSTLIIKDETVSTRSDANKIAISASGGDTIDHSATYTLSGDNPALTIYSNGVSKWFIY
jgi:hypothetical protein